MNEEQLYAAVEAVLFAFAEPITAQKLAEALEVEPARVQQVLHTMQQQMEDDSRGMQLLQLEDAWQFASKSAYGDYVKSALDNRRNAPLTPAALEVLAIIAYNQPVSRSFIDQVRGVDSYSTVMNLVGKGLIEEAGRLDLPGRPVAFRTTDAFLRTFGITSLHQLPPLHAEGEAASPEDEMYAVAHQTVLLDEEPDEETKALRGGAFIEGEGGSADLVGEGE